MAKPRLTPAQAATVRKRHRSGVSQAALARDYRVSRRTISRVIGGTSHRPPASRKAAAEPVREAVEALLAEREGDDSLDAAEAARAEGNSRRDG
jgi:transcriptional regulator with XRE-family HTH domain